MPTQVNQATESETKYDKRYSRMSTMSKVSRFTIVQRKTIALTDYKQQPVLHKFKDDEFYYEAVPMCCGLWTIYKKVETDGMEIEEILSDIDSDEDED